MSWLVWALVIFLTAAVTMLGAAVLIGRQPRIPLDRLADPAPPPYELPRAGLLPLHHLPETGPSGPWLDSYPVPFSEVVAPYGPFPVDTGPLLILSEQAAANVALEREIRQRCAEAEAKIPPRWR